MSAEPAFRPLPIAVLTISDRRTETDDESGRLLAQWIDESGHRVAEKILCADDPYQIRAHLSRWIADPTVAAIVTTGGTGLTGRDVTPEAVLPLLDKTIDGFGELFRALSYETIGTSTLQSRALAGVANGTIVFCLPGSPGACKDGWSKIIVQQLDVRTRPCNLVELMPRLRER